MERKAHLQWCKDRANEYVENGDLQQAFASFTRDMGEHPETANHVALQMGMMLLLNGSLSTPSQMREWINGFN